MNAQTTGDTAAVILIVVKDNELRMQLQRDLDLLGYTTVEAPSAESAVKYLNDSTPDLIVMDVDLPGVSGIQACRKMRSNSRLAKTPVLLLVAHEDVDVINKAFDAGATDCIVKSVTPGVVSIRVRYALRNSHQALDLTRQQEQLNQAQQVAKLGYWRLDVVTQSLTLSDFALQLLQTERGSRLTTLSDYLSHVHVADREEVKLALERAFYDKQSFSIDHRVIVRGGQEVYLHIQGEVIFDNEDRPISMFGTMQDITTRKRNEVTNEHLALYDSLTDLCNRRLFQNRLAYLMNTTLRDEKLLALCFFDLDKFKAINDNLGHAFGDELLKAVAKRLRSTMRQGDLIARISGDEFALAIEGLNNVEELEKILEKLLSRLASPYSIRGHTLMASASIGVALYPLDSANRETMMRYADAAMYKAKESGGNCYCYYTHDMNDKSRRRLELETKLRHAVSQNQIRVYYQPQVNINTNTVIGFEALARWDHPEYGILPPAKFISIAEDTGMIQAIGDWVLATACKQIMMWEKNGLGRFRLAVNVSARQLSQTDLVSKIETVLQETHMPASRLCIEVKESAVMKESVATMNVLNNLKTLGLCLAIDDFGVGHSSMNQLQKLPVDAITVDRSFVMNIAGRERDGIGAKAIIGLAKNLGLHVTAEGVETKTQVEFLRHQLCEEAQGHYYSPPIPAQQVPQFIVSMTDMRRSMSEPL